MWEHSLSVASISMLSRAIEVPLSVREARPCLRTRYKASLSRVSDIVDVNSEGCDETVVDAVESKPTSHGFIATVNRYLW
jgi:hypothetical protein